MVRTQILLTAAQHKRLKRLARKRNESLSQLVREAVDRLPEDAETARERAKALLGAFRSDRDDASVRHDEYLAEGDGA